MQHADAKQPKRLVHLDMLRLTAIYLVIFNHTGSNGYMLFAECMGSALYFPYMMASVFCKVAVPIFFMISGALLLPKEETLGRLFSKRVLRMAVVLLLISVPYYFLFHREAVLGIAEFLSYIYANSASTALWYLYSYIALLLMMPFLRRMARAMTEGEYLYLIAGYVIMVGLVPCVEYCLFGGNQTIHSSFEPVLFLTQNTFYTLVGYYLEHIVDLGRWDKRILVSGLLFNVLAFAATGFMTNLIMRSGERDATQLQRFFNCFICIPSISLYLLMKHLGTRVTGAKIHEWLSALGGAVFGVYLIEKFLRALTGGVYRFLLSVLGSFAASLVWCFAVLFLSLLIVLLAKHTPVIKNAVNRFI